MYYYNSILRLFPKSSKHIKHIIYNNNQYYYRKIYQICLYNITYIAIRPVSDVNVFTASFHEQVPVMGYPRSIPRLSDLLELVTSPDSLLSSWLQFIVTTAKRYRQNQREKMHGAKLKNRQAKLLGIPPSVVTQQYMLNSLAVMCDSMCTMLPTKEAHLSLDVFLGVSPLGIQGLSD